MKSLFGWLKNSTKIKRWITLMLLGMVLACYGFAQILVVDRLELIDIIKIVITFVLGIVIFIIGLVYIQKRTLELAILQDSKETITNIALDCGFESQRTFNRVFREKYKMSPREFRNRAIMLNAGENSFD